MTRASPSPKKAKTPLALAKLDIESWVKGGWAVDWRAKPKRMMNTPRKKVKRDVNIDAIPWDDLWAFLRKKGWRTEVTEVACYCVPSGKHPKKGGMEGKDYFTAPSLVVAYLKEHEEMMKGF